MDKTKKKNRDVPISIITRLGSSVGSITVQGKTLFKRAGLKYSDQIMSMTADWNQNPPESLGNFSEQNISNDEFIRVAYPANEELLRETDLQGTAWNMGPQWYMNLGAASDGMGACGDLNHGRMMAKLNEKFLCKKFLKLIQAARDYLNEIHNITKGNDLQETGRVPITLSFSTVGAMGNGTAYWSLTEGLPFSTHQAKIPTKIIAHLILCGNLSTQNQKDPRLNEVITLKQFQVWTSGKYVDPIKGCLAPIPFSYCNLSSNLNEHGNFTSLYQLMSHEAHAEFFYWATPAGKLMRERAADFEGITYDKHGDPLCGQTQSIAKISCDSRRVTFFCILHGISLYCSHLTEIQDEEHYINEAIGLSRNQSIMETEDDNLLTSDIIRPEELGRENVTRLAQESIQDRVSESRGFQKALQLDEAIADTLNHDIPSFYEPAMQKKAQQKYEDTCRKINVHIQQNLQTATGMSGSLQMLTALRQIVEDSLHVIRQKKIPEIEGFLMPHQMVIADASEQIGQLQHRGFLTRLMSVFLIRQLISDLEESGLAAVSHQLELTCCQVADSQFLSPLIEIIDKNIGLLASTLQKTQNIAQASYIQAGRLAAENTIDLNPNGLEITSPQYLQNYFQEYLKNNGGSDRVCKHLQGLFLDQNGSMEVFLKTPQAELHDKLCQLAETIFEPVVKSTTVWDEVIKTFPDNHTRQKLFTKLIRHSEGRVLTEDAPGQNVIWVKTANVPDKSLIEPIRKLLESLDKKPGKWEVAFHDDIDTISIGQTRGAISLNPFIRRLGIPDNPIGWKALAEKAIDVVGALIIPPNPNLQQFKRVMAKAVITDLITEKDGHFHLNRPNTEPLNLGPDLESAKTRLLPKWPDMVFIESTYAREIIIDEERILSRIDNFGKNSDTRCILFDQKAIDECLCQTEIMLPRLRRIRVAAMREEQL